MRNCAGLVRIMSQRVTRELQSSQLCIWQPPGIEKDTAMHVDVFLKLHTIRAAHGQAPASDQAWGFNGYRHLRVKGIPQPLDGHGMMQYTYNCISALQ